MAIEINGWAIYAHRAFLLQLFRLKSVVAKRGIGCPDAKILKWLVEAIQQRIPADPTNEYFRQGDMLGKEHTHWFRDKYKRFRLFYRCDTSARTIIIGWVNDTSTLRERGAKTDVYAVFRGMLEKGSVPTEWEALLRQALDKDSIADFESWLS